MLRIDPDSINAKLNLGSLAFLEEDYQAALTAFESAEETVADGGRVRESQRVSLYLNLSKTHYALENYENARDYYVAVERVDADEAARFSYLGGAGHTGVDSGTAAGGIGGSAGSEGVGIAEVGEAEDVAGGLGRASQAADAEPILFFPD